MSPADGWQFSIIVIDPASTNLTLNIVPSGANVVITWAQTCTTYSLKGTADLTPVAVWTPVAQPKIPVGANFEVTVPAIDPLKFFPLRRQWRGNKLNSERPGFGPVSSFAQTWDGNWAGGLEPESRSRNHRWTQLRTDRNQLRKTKGSPAE